jgi:hypothetical protein
MSGVDWVVVVVDVPIPTLDIEAWRGTNWLCETAAVDCSDLIAALALVCAFGLPFFLIGPMYVSALRSWSDCVTGVDDTRGGFFGLVFAFVRFCIEAIVARVSAHGSSLVD